jgi:hypothetical protein
MSRIKVEWGMLRGAIGVFAICALVSGGLLSASYYFREEMDTEYRNYHTRFRDVSRKYLAVDDEERIIEEAYPTFVKLFESGILGQEHRLSWIEALTNAGEKIKLPEIGYRISAQTVLDPDFPVSLGAFDIYVSEMTLNLGLLHEGDFLELLQALNANADGLYSVSRCDAQKVPVTGLDLKRAQITADCRLNWYTVDLKGTRKLSL